MLDWLESSSRLIAREPYESAFSEQEEEISDFLGGEDAIGDLDYDDDNDIAIDED
jgi:hypothetical protein